MLFVEIMYGFLVWQKSDVMENLKLLLKMLFGLRASF